MSERPRCIATKPRLIPTMPDKQCPPPAKYGPWCRQHAESLGGWRLAPPDPMVIVLSDEQQAILHDHLASRQQTASQFFGDVLMEYGLGRAIGKEYPPPAGATPRPR
jgi:hypothetical protein